MLWIGSTGSIAVKVRITAPVAGGIVKDDAAGAGLDDRGAAFHRQIALAVKGQDIAPGDARGIFGLIGQDQGGNAGHFCRYP